IFLLFFFFQAEDGIRDFHVTGVQTCALPISRYLGSPWATIAVTLPLIDRENCEITSADMVFNGERFVFRTDGNLSNAAEVDFESIAIHEFGHWIGLDHSRNPDEPGGYEPASVMFPSYRG